MANAKVRRKAAKRVKKPKEVAGEAAAAEKNRQRETRSCIVEAYLRLGIEFKKWPAFVQAFHTTPQVQYHFAISPLPFQAPDFDPLNQSPEAWVKDSDEAWKKHQNEFLQKCKSWVKSGVDEEIAAPVPTRGSGKKGPTQAVSRKRKDNTPVDKRYEWVARYLDGELFKVIAGADYDASAVGRVVKGILHRAGWSRKPKGNKTGSTP